MPVEKPVENLIMVVNGGPYKHLSLRCADLSSGCINSSHSPIKFSTGLWKNSISFPQA